MLQGNKFLLVVLACLVLLMPALNCAPQQHPKKLELQLEKAPRLNEPVKLTCTRNISFNSLQIGITSDNVSYEKINLDFRRINPKTGGWVKVQPEEILVEGSFNWETAIKVDKPGQRIEVSPQDVLVDDKLNFEDAARRGIPLEFPTIVKFPYEGNWSIIAESTRTGLHFDGMNVYVAEDGGMLGWQKDYRPPTGPFPSVPGNQFPMTVEVDIAKVPRLDEPVEFTWTINSIQDIAKFDGEVKFYVMNGTEKVELPLEDILVEGDLTWEGSLKKDSPLKLSAVIAFPQEGDWWIHAWVVRPRHDGGSNYPLFLHVGKDKGRFGWAEPHRKRPSADRGLHK